MFNIKQLVNKITDKSTGQRMGESSTPVLDSDGQHSAEGFLCPPCMKAFPSAEALEEHYLKTHPMEGGGAASNSDGDIQFLRQEIENLQTSLVEEKSMSEELKKEVLKIQSEITKKESENGDMQDARDQSNSMLKSEVNLLRQQLTDQLEHLAQLRKEKELLKEKLLVLASQNDTLAEDNKVLQGQLAHRNSIDDAAVLRQELVSVQRLMDQVTQEKEKEVENLLSKVKQLEQTLEEVRALQEESNAELKKAELEHEQLVKLTDENYQLRKDLADSLAVQIKKDGNIDELKEKLGDAQSKIESLEVQNARLEQEKEKTSTTESNESKEELSSDNAALMKTEIDKLQSHNSELTRNLHNLKLKIEKYESDSRKLVETHAAERKSVQVKFTEYEANLNDKDEEIKKKEVQYKSILAEKTTELQSLNDKVSNLSSELINKEKQLEESKVSKETISNELSALEKEFHTLKEEHEKLKDSLITLEEYSTSLSKESDERLKSMEELQKRLDECSTSLQDKSATIGSLEDALKSLRIASAEKEKALEKSVVESLNQIEQLRLEYESREKTTSSVIAENKSQIKTLESSVDEKVQEINNVKTLLADTEAFASQTAVKVQSLEAKLQELEVLNDELKYKLKSSEEEKALLAERCLTEQSKAEQSVQAYEECRRKLDDSVAALQELGRENQSLQMESAKLQGRKWADDSVVTTCTGCVREFSLTIRKHHCRHCGQIFCNDCSSRTASVPSSKKPVRVCEVCFQELTSK